MTDQINAVGGLASGLPAALPVGAAPGPAPDLERTAKIAGTLPQGQGPSPTPETSGAAMNQLNGHLQQAGSELKIQADKDSGRTVYKVVNPATGEIVYQYPTEEMLAMARSLQTSEKQLGTSGVLVDKQG